MSEKTTKKGKTIPKNIYEELSKPLPQEAIQKTKGSLTKKGYDTTGYGYQYLVNRFNEVMGVGNWNWGFEVIKEEEGVFTSGKPYWEITGKATIEVGQLRHAEYGGHRSSNYVDALKGASTNAFKKAAGFFGVGRQAFEGSIDEDNREVVGFDKDKTEKPKISVWAFLNKMEKELKTKDDIPFWESEIDNSKYNDMQKVVAHRKLEELTKEL